MRFTIKLVVYPIALNILLLFTSVTFAAQATSSKHCVKKGKNLPIAKTKRNCTKHGGTWIKKRSRKMPIDPYDKNKAMPVDPYDKSKTMPIDPYDKNKAMPTEPLKKNKSTR